MSQLTISDFLGDKPIRFLSYELANETPGFGGQKEVFIQQTRCMTTGASCNRMHISLSNHIGTHVDSPRHFSINGAAITDFPAAHWLCRRPFLLHVKASNDQLIDLRDFASIIPSDADCLLIKTGFSQLRQQSDYWEHNPGIKAESGSWLRQTFPELRFIGFDFISLTAYQHRQEGREAHLCFLAPDRPGRPIMIIEDMNLEALETAPECVMICPMQISGADGASATIISIG